MDNQLNIYTDGACKNHTQGNGPGGWGVLFIYGDHEQEMSGGEKATTNNRMELLAAIKALEYLEKPHKNIIIYTDSQYVQNGINLWIHNWKKRGWKGSTGKPVKNIDLWKRIDKQNKRHKVEWKWVKGHSGHRENNIVDRLAVNAIPSR
jgi:ribonuclease HI